MKLKIIQIILPFIFTLFFGCATPPITHGIRPNTKSNPQPLLIFYHVKPGKEKQLEKLVEQTWQFMLAKKMVFKSPHLFFSINGGAEYVESFVLVSCFVLEWPPAELANYKTQIAQLCQPTNDSKEGVQYLLGEINYFIAE